VEKLVAPNILVIDELKGHEDVDPRRLKGLIERIASDRVLRRPIAADKITHVILDGHHRLEALMAMNCRRVPVVLLDYLSPEIHVVSWKTGEEIRKDIVLEAALTGRKLAPRTTKHMVQHGGKLWHISVLERRIDIALEELRERLLVR